MGTRLSGRRRCLQQWLFWEQPCAATFAENPLQPGKGLRPGNAHVGEEVVIPSAFQMNVRKTGKSKERGVWKLESELLRRG